VKFIKYFKGWGAQAIDVWEPLRYVSYVSQCRLKSYYFLKQHSPVELCIVEKYSVSFTVWAEFLNTVNSRRSSGPLS
jgi:hypothetical protein